MKAYSIVLFLLLASCEHRTDEPSPLASANFISFTIDDVGFEQYYQNQRITSTDSARHHRGYPASYEEKGDDSVLVRRVAAFDFDANKGLNLCETVAIALEKTEPRSVLNLDPLNKTWAYKDFNDEVSFYSDYDTEKILLYHCYWVAEREGDCVEILKQSIVSTGGEKKAYVELSFEGLTYLITRTDTVPAFQLTAGEFRGIFQ